MRGPVAQSTSSSDRPAPASSGDPQRTGMTAVDRVDGMVEQLVGALGRPARGTGQHDLDLAHRHAAGDRLMPGIEEDAEPDLGNGGPGRRAACSQDSLAHRELPAPGDGIGCEFGLVAQHRVQRGETIDPVAAPSKSISIAGPETSRTSTRKFTLHGALTIGSVNGANRQSREPVRCPWSQPAVGTRRSPLNISWTHGS